ncbi:hypothetical protein GGR54DRAFT_182687 [Hypoxylon sp. NC1633]|nr:hypothetical protein GGR54DRAFT_182687 [Hypoxylon sp. NC1633]
MVLCTRLFTSLAVIVSIAASSLEKRGPSIILGYRTVGPDQAESYHKAGNTLVYQQGHSSDQLGPGAYISPILGDWPQEGGTFWDCAILADSTAWSSVNKAWLPESIGSCTPLWFSKGEPNRNAYLQGLGAGFTTSNTVLFSQIHGFKEKLQMLIPPTLMGSSGGLNIHVQCAQKSNTKDIADISIYGDVDWYSWPDVAGTPQHVNP